MSSERYNFLPNAKKISGSATVWDPPLITIAAADSRYFNHSPFSADLYIHTTGILKSQPAYIAFFFFALTSSL